MTLHAENRRRIAATSAMLVIALVAAGGGASAGPSKGAPGAVHGSSERASWPQGHLYVLDVNGAVDRFALAPDGRPAARADSVLNLEGAQYPLGLAVDRSGHVFVADEEAGVVNEYAAGATGQQEPIATLELPNDGPDLLKMDSAERLYVHYGGGNQSQSIAIFAKGARGNDAPISVVPPYYDPELASDYVITQAGALYVLDLSPGAKILGYSDPLRRPSAPDVFMWPQGGWEFDLEYNLALDDATDRLYIEFVSRSQYGWNKTNFAVRQLSDSSGALDSMFFNGQCGNRQWSGTDGAVVVKRYVLVSCEPDNDVLVFRKDRFGRRQADEIVGRGAIQGIAQIAVGP